MIRIAKLTDYATLLMVHLARAPGRSFSAAQLAEALGVPHPTVAKLLKRLLRADLLTSTRGAGGGYRLAQAPEAISVAAIVGAVEGPLALTDCARGSGQCTLERRCATRDNWLLISRAVQVALETISLADMARPQTAPLPLQSLQA